MKYPTGQTFSLEQDIDLSRELDLTEEIEGNLDLLSYFLSIEYLRLAIKSKSVNLKIKRIDRI